MKLLRILSIPFFVVGWIAVFPFVILWVFVVAWNFSRYDSPEDEMMRRPLQRIKNWYWNWLHDQEDGTWKLKYGRWNSGMDLPAGCDGKLPIRARIHIWLARRVGIKQGTMEYPLSFRARILRLVFYFPQRLKEAWLWWTKL